jgi:type III pantothenate kinase
MEMDSPVPAGFGSNAHRNEDRDQDHVTILQPSPDFVNLASLSAKTMELVLDFGNTGKKIALYQEGKMVLLQQHPEISVDIIRDFVEKNKGIGYSILSSVVEHPAGIDDFLKASFPSWILDSHTPLPVPGLEKAPEALGKDRLAAAVAGSAMFPGQHVLVINTGTAITYDVVSPEGDYLGGAISPGMALRFKALNTFTGKLPLIEYRESVPLLGNDTENSILSGVVNGIAGEMGSYAGLCIEKFPSINIILSGGDLNYFAKRLKINIFAVSNIVLTGLHQILLFNVAKAG